MLMLVVESQALIILVVRRWIIGFERLTDTQPELYVHIVPDKATTKLTFTESSIGIPHCRGSSVQHWRRFKDVSICSFW